ncbi:MAG TPA: cupin domain-containing protein [Pseudomonadota bacterium]|nr:cupin domain-containing protein [Pseudomonadota bacterium]HNO67532.1 cupin domain-containing protein [Pseudomonadota bacterium]
MSQKTSKEHLLTAEEIANGPELALSHPLNREKSEVHIRPLGARVGLARTQVSMGRIPPGKESFIFHRHLADEEWVYILSGRGEAKIGDETFAVSAGSFMGFPTPSLGHSLMNTAEEDLVYLMGGERSRLEVAEFPTAGKHAIFSAEGIFLIDSQQLQRMGFDDYVKKG